MTRCARAIMILWATTLAFAAMFCIRGCVQDGIKVNVNLNWQEK